MSNSKWNLKQVIQVFIS